MKKGWQVKTIGEISTVKGGKRVPKGYKLQTEPTAHPYITVADFTEDGTVSTEKLKYVSDDVYEQIKNYTISSEDLYISIAGTIGKSGIVPNSLDGANLTENACKLILQKGINQRFVYYFTKTNSFLEQTGIHTRVAAQPKLALVRLKTISLPVPPLVEQKRIVAILDEAFEGIEVAIANTEKNLTNARELFESYLNAIFTRKGDDWVEKKLQDILLVQPRNGWSPPAKHHSDTGTPVLTLSSVTGFQFNKNKVKYTSAATKPDAHYWLNNGEFLITRSNTKELVGHVAICEGLNEPTICCDLIMKMQIDPQQADSRFVYWHFRTRELRELISNSAQGANPTMRKINKSIVQNFPVSLPGPVIQKDLVKKIDAFETETQRLEAIYQRKLAALKELKQSILQKAFSGELTAETANQVASAAREVAAA